MNIFRKPRLTPRRRGETEEQYLNRIYTTEEEKILYWKTLTKELYRRDKRAIRVALESLEKTNLEAHKIVLDTYHELEGQ